MPRSFHYTVIGRVQGVYFRVFAQRAANELGVKGYVKNDATGNVSGMAQGEEGALEKFKEAIAQGPRHARVTEVKLTDEAEGIRPTADILMPWTSVGLGIVMGLDTPTLRALVAQVPNVWPIA